MIDNIPIWGFERSLWCIKLELDEINVSFSDISFASLIYSASFWSPYHVSLCLHHLLFFLSTVSSYLSLSFLFSFLSTTSLYYFHFYLFIPLAVSSPHCSPITSPSLCSINLLTFWNNISSSSLSLSSSISPQVGFLQFFQQVSGECGRDYQTAQQEPHPSPYQPSIRRLPPWPRLRLQPYGPGRRAEDIAVWPRQEGQQYVDYVIYWTLRFVFSHLQTVVVVVLTHFVVIGRHLLFVVKLKLELMIRENQSYKCIQ